MQHEMRGQFLEGRASVRRSVPAILARKARAERQRRQEFPPDFFHGEVAVGELYESFGAPWVERALFLVEGEHVRTAAYFDDYFLVVEQWVRGEEVDYGWWIDRVSEDRDQVVRLSTGDCEDGEILGEICIQVERERLVELERQVLGVVRDGFLEDETVQGKLRQGHVDILSLVTLTSRLGA